MTRQQQDATKSDRGVCSPDTHLDYRPHSHSSCTYPLERRTPPSIVCLLFTCFCLSHPPGVLALFLAVDPRRFRYSLLSSHTAATSYPDIASSLLLHNDHPSPLSGAYASSTATTASSSTAVSSAASSAAPSPQSGYYYNSSNNQQTHNQQQQHEGNIIGGSAGEEGCLVGRGESDTCMCFACHMSGTHRHTDKCGRCCDVRALLSSLLLLRQVHPPSMC